MLFSLSLHIERLSLTAFRNYGSAELELHPGVNLIHGENGQGKTNLLEAVHFLCLAYSPRTRRERELIQWGEEGFVLRFEARVSGSAHAQAVEYLRGGRKRIRVGGQEYQRYSELMGHVGAVAFSPEDISLLNGPPSERRRFLDSLLCQQSHEYLHQLSMFTRALRQRNALLKQEAPDQGLLDAFTTQLVESGARVAERRIHFLDFFAPQAKESYDHISAGKEKLGLRFVSSFSKATEFAGLAADFHQALENGRREERARGTTLVGPHRDELLLLLGGKSARDYASQGQKRSIALSLALASAANLEAHFRCPPVLLVDDVIAELDDARREALGGLIRRGGQVLVATPRKSDLPLQADRVFEVTGGELCVG